MRLRNGHGFHRPRLGRPSGVQVQVQVQVQVRFRCSTDPAHRYTDALCSDGVDNDYDSFVDCEDFACLYGAGVTVCLVPCPVKGPENSFDACLDGGDNDLDGFVDCLDFDCSSIFDCR